MQYLTYIIKRFFLILLPFRRVKGSFISLVSGILILFGGILYAETETDNNSCISADIVLAPGIYTGTIGGESALGDYDYFEFNTPLNGTLTVELINNDNRVLNYSSLSTSCPSSTPNTLGNNATVRLTISSTSSGKYYLLLQGNKKNQATNYTINATFTPNVPTTGVDLKVTKVASVGETLIYNPFYYTVSVSNVGDQDATDINLTDTLPSGMRVDTVQTNDLAADWTCTGTIGTTLCTYDGGSLDAGDISIFKLYVQAPPSPGYITNEINVSSSQTDVDTTNNIDTETTYITNEVDTAEHICYYERTEINNPNYETACEKKGNFYYGNGCDASILIMEVNATDKLSQISIYKMYAPETKSGSCTYDSDTSANSTNGTQCSNLANTTEFGSYTEGYALTLNENNVSNIEVRMYDSDTYNTPRIDGIAMFGDYMTELGFHHTGRIYDCNGTSEGGVVVTSSADLIDTSIDVSNASTYNAHAADVEGSLKYIQTMVAGAPSREVNGVHLNLAGEAVAYETDTGIPYSIVPYMSDDTCSLTIDNIINPNTGQQLVLDVLPGTISAQNQMIVPTSVSKASRMQLIFVDPNSLSVEGQNCLANSSTTGNFARLAQCVNSEVQYKTAFGQDAWDRCGKDGGKPCLSQNNGSADPTDPSYDPATDSIYVNQLGCYMCTFNIQPSCTTDNFAIRPDRMQVGMTHPDAPDLLRAGKEYPLSLTARYPDDGIYTNGSAIPTDAVVTDYTVNDHNYNSDLESEEIRYFKNGQPDTEEILAGTSEVDISRTGFMVGGLSSQNLFGPSNAPNPDETAAVSYTDVGTIMLNIYDKEWAAVDNDDTPMDCNTSRAHTYICTYDMVTFIPHHFSVDNIVLRNHNDGNFTYLSNDLNMSAHMDVTISALNAEGNVTRNFREGELFYENPVSVDLNVTEWNPSLANKHPLNNDTLIHDIPNELLLGFGGEGEANGTRNITWNDSNLSHRLMFNYQRYNNQPLNPFRVPESDVNISVASTYTASGKTAVIIGTGVETDERNATFYFGRAKASKDFYDVKGTVATTPITALVYCDIFPTCAFFPDSIQLTGQTNLNNWWLSLDHNENTGDGSITLEDPPTLSLGNGSATVDTDVNIIADAQDSSIQVERTSGSTTAIFDIFLNTSTPTTTHSWMIYNANSPTLPPDPFYKVRFTGDSGWAGVGETGHVLDVNASTTKTKRLNW